MLQMEQTYFILRIINHRLINNIRNISPSTQF